MEIITAVKATEQEIVDLINKRFPDTDLESIVAAEELGNQDWVLDVAPVSMATIAEFEIGYLLGETTMFKTAEALGILCAEKVIPAGEYIIDCTW
jgi:hypothetical protein